MISIALRIFAIAWSALLITLIGFGTLSPAKIGTMTWGPTVDFWAISIAISKIEYGLKGKLGYREVLQALADHLTTTKNDMDIMDEGTKKLLQQPDTISRAIQAAAQLKRENLKPQEKKLGGYVTTLAEDVGYADFYNVAFRIFGYSSRSTHYLYMGVLALSFGFFILVYWRESVPIGVLTLGITALFLTTTTSLVGIPNLPSMAANRFLSTLALVPLLHLVIAILERRPLRTGEMFVIALQSALLLFASWARSSAHWTIIAALLLSLIVAFIRTPAPRMQNLARGMRIWWDALRARSIENWPWGTRRRPESGRRSEESSMCPHTRWCRPCC
jgi:hypothetical protein